MKKVPKRWLPPQRRILGGSLNAVFLLGPPYQGPINEIMRWPEAQAVPATVAQFPKMA